MVAEPTTTTYTDADLQAIIEAYALIDADGYEPDSTSWTDTYDLNAAAADIWTKKQAALAALYDFSADGGSFKRSQAFEMAGKMARKYGAMRAPSSLRVKVSHDYEEDFQAKAVPDPLDFGTTSQALPDYVVNRAEDDD